MDTISTGRKSAAAEIGIQMPESKVSAAESAAMSGPLVLVSGTGDRPAARRRWAAAEAMLRVLCAVSSVVALSVMVSSEQRGSISLFGFRFPLHSNWSFSDSLEYLVGITAVAAVHSVLQLLLSTRELLKKAPAIPSRRPAWILFAVDQAFAYAMMSAGSAAAGVTNLNRTGIRHAALPDLCKPLHHFCDRLAISITFAFLSFLFLAGSAVLDVLCLCCRS